MADRQLVPGASQWGLQGAIPRRKPQANWVDGLPVSVRTQSTAPDRERATSHLHSQEGSTSVQRGRQEGVEATAQESVLHPPAVPHELLE